MLDPADAFVTAHDTAIITATTLEAKKITIGPMVIDIAAKTVTLDKGYSVDDAAREVIDKMRYLTGWDIEIPS